MKRTLFTASIAGLGVLHGCGDGNIQRGVFIDSPVEGLEYRTETRHGYTDADGGFYYKPGETVLFSVGGLRFSEVEAQPTVTPLDIVGTENIEDPEVVNILRLLQSIDVDQNPANGITIPESARENVQAPEFSFSGMVNVDEVISNALTQAYGDTREIVGAEQAVEHLVDTLSREVSDTSIAGWDLDFLYLVEKNTEFDGSYISLRENDFELNLNNEWQYGAVSNNRSVYQLLADDKNQFLTLGVGADGSRMGCLASLPQAIAQCASEGRLFSVFSEESGAVAFSASQTAGTVGSEATDEVEPEFEAAESGGVDTSGDLLRPEDLFPACTATAVDADGDGYSWENGASCYIIAGNTDSSVVDETDDTTETESVAAVATVVASTDCPSGTLNAPASFQVVVAQPPGCEWVPFTDDPAWAWGTASSYDNASNTVTAALGGLHQGTFEHSCTDIASGKMVKVVASCEVTVNNAPGIEDITDLFFMTGQSNAASLQTAYDATLDSSDSNVFAFTDTGWQVADLHQFWEQDIPGNYSQDDPARSPYNSIIFQVAKALAAKSDRVVGIVILTAPGEGISHWDYNSEFFIEIREKALAALNSLPNKHSFDAMFWMQGETDWLAEGTADPGATGFSGVDSDFYRNYYPNKLFQLISNLRSESWFGGDGRFVCAETKKALLNPHLMALNFDDDPLSGCAAAADLETRDTDPYGNHFSAPSLRILGDRLADVYLGLNP